MLGKCRMVTFLDDPPTAILAVSILSLALPFSRTHCKDSTASSTAAG